ncbi:hypothetical protein [Taklimakanibacter albus]|uniref:Uncharacterized protein n=1 Tax=Taklimakanibacter albus TaxID=2800327 RepID=A0ACC5QY15_9HYPH|nr:hypothetical protein [Aestuariivirga sp. YIM B02566]MBK1865286.1 hypothetical protein [Aestuariivirga sp. YIM B02566]
MARKAKAKQTGAKDKKAKSKKAKPSPKKAAKRAPIQPAIKKAAAPAKRRAVPLDPQLQERVQRSLRACMRSLTTHGDYGMEDGPGTWEMSNQKWEEVLTCVCRRIGLAYSVPLLNDTKNENFSDIIGILARRVRG